uniref:Zinc finger FYVE-type containing 9 n=1 Tax=Oryzias latipes TaxID=8090 RepID=H2LF08_ORYLA
MENYFQAEAFNLDKVLDEFEQNEDETDTFSDAKWTQILAPPAHMFSLNPALTHTDLSPRESSHLFKGLPDSSSSASLGGDPKRHPGAEPASWAEERPADVHSPPLPQPNIGKLVGADDASPTPVTACGTVENSCSGSPPLVEPPAASSQEPKLRDTPTSVGGAGSSVSHFTFEVGSGQDPPPSVSLHPAASAGRQNGEHAEGQSGAAVSPDLHPESVLSTEETPERLNGGEDSPPACEREEKNVYSPAEEGEEKEERKAEPLFRKTNLQNGLEGAMERSSTLHTTEEKDEEEFSPSPVSSKEDSVTEEKEMEESKQEAGDAGAVGSGLLQTKLGNNRLQPVSVPYGGARPKQTVSLKLQIPQPLPGQLQNQLGQAAAGKNKNLDSQGRRGAPSEPSPAAADQGSVSANGDRGAPFPSARPPESPDNDLQAGQQGDPSRKASSALGDVAPVWVPDSQAPVCMKCDVKFTFTKRRHHCRACGKVFCAACCSLKCKLAYMDRKEARVCVTCHSTLTRSVSRDQRRVWFADGVLPNGDATDSYKPSSSSSAPSQQPQTPVAPAGSPVGSSLSLIPEDGLPPILISTGVKGDYAVEERPAEVVLMQQLEEGGPDPLVFVLNANLLAMVKLVNYVNRKCWYMTTKGMHAVGQAEIVVLIQCLPDEKTIPKDVLTHFVQLYQEALSGNMLSHLSHSFFTQSFLGSKEHGGFLYISPSFQSLQDLLLPNPPFLFGILIQKWETPWAKVFPIRLMLRLGAEYRFYPCPLFSVRFRKPLFGETGHTIMNLLADFRNYQYTLPIVKGLVVDMEVRKTTIKIPSNRYNELMKAMNKSNEHVLAMGACFNDRADSHLVCVQNDDGNYQTQAISIHHQPRKVTGACFFVFSGALKASSGFLAKTSIVEDGVMIQITAETMDSLRQALRDMKDFTITCGKADREENQELVHILWTEDDQNFNKGVISPIDGKSMESISSVKIFHGSEFKANGKVIRWTEVFFLQSEDQSIGLSDPADHSRLTENVARAFCMALCPHLKLLKEDGMAKLGLRVTLDSDQVGYLAGSNGQPLLPQYLSDLDSALIPVIHGGACQLSEGPVVMELVFYILEIIS